MIFDWKTWFALALTLGPIALQFIPYTKPLFSAFLKTSIGRALLAAVAIVACALWIAAYYQNVGYDRGVQKTQERIEQQNTTAIRRANEAARTVDDCYDRGGKWDQSTGRCLE